MENDSNIYEAPKSDLMTPEMNSNDEFIKVGKAQKLILYAILAQIGSIVLQFLIPVIGMLAAWAAIIMGIVGLVKLIGALGGSTISKILCGIGMFIPLVSLIILLVFSSKATNLLRENGYKVGLLGAKGL